MKTCPKCGSPNEDLLTHCERCRARLPRGAPPSPGGADIEPVKNYTLFAVLATLLFVPFGLLAILHAAQVSGWHAADQRDRAQAASQLARRWALAGIVTGLIVNSALILAARLV